MSPLLIKIILWAIAYLFLVVAICRFVAVGAGEREDDE